MLTTFEPLCLCFGSTVARDPDPPFGTGRPYPISSLVATFAIQPLDCLHLVSWTRWFESQRLASTARLSARPRSAQALISSSEKRYPQSICARTRPITSAQLDADVSLVTLAGPKGAAAASPPAGQGGRHPAEAQRPLGTGIQLKDKGGGAWGRRHRMGHAASLHGGATYKLGWPHSSTAAGWGCRCLPMAPVG